MAGLVTAPIQAFKGQFKRLTKNPVQTLLDPADLKGKYKRIKRDGLAVGLLEGTGSGIGEGPSFTKLMR